VDLLELLKGGVWHATSAVNFNAIYADGCVKASPPATRYENSFCRSLGKVSLFDFRDAPNLWKAIERNDWASFTSIPPEGASVWLRIDHSRIHIPSCVDLLKEWNDGRDSGQPLSLNMRIISDLETGRAGDLPTTSFSEVLLIDGARTKMIPFDDLAADKAEEFFAEPVAAGQTDFARLMEAAQKRSNLK